MNISDRIQALRKSRGISQEQLADVLGVSRQAVSKWEAEQSSPDLERIVAMAEYFDVTTDYLLRGIEPAKEKKSRADARTLCIVSTAVNAVGLIIGAALWRTYQNAFAPAFILSAQAAGLVLWLLAKGEKPRWYWAANVWLLGVLPSYWLGELGRIALYRLPSSPFARLLIIAAPVIPLAIAGGVVTYQALRKK